MKKQQVNKDIGDAADESEQTIELLSGKIDASTQCSPESESSTREQGQRQVANSTDKSDRP